MSNLGHIISAHVVDGCKVKVYLDDGEGHIEIIRPCGLGNTVLYTGEMADSTDEYVECGAEVEYAQP